MTSYRASATLISLLLILCLASFAQSGGGSSSQGASSAPTTVTSVLDRSLTGIERTVLRAADAVPEDKYDFSPATANVPGDFKTPTPVRTMGEQFRHIGDALESYSAAILGEKRPETSDENGPKNLKSKQDVINYLKSAFSKAHTAVNTINQQNLMEDVQAGNNKVPRLTIAIQMIAHSNNHYGQLIEYMRMNGIVPPESQPRR